MGRGGSGDDTKQKKRGSRSRKLQLLLPTSAISRMIKERKPRSKRVGDRAIAYTAALVEHFCRMLMEDACGRVKNSTAKTINVQHLAQSLNDPNTPFHGIFNARVACVFTSKDTDADNAEAEQVEAEDE